jgi:hypothetical protein
MISRHGCVVEWARDRRTMCALKETLSSAMRARVSWFPAPMFLRASRLFSIFTLSPSIVAKLQGHTQFVSWFLAGSQLCSSVTTASGLRDGGGGDRRRLRRNRRLWRGLLCSLYSQSHGSR